MQRGARFSVPFMASTNEILNGKQQHKDPTSAGRVLDLYLQTKAVTTSLAWDS